MKIHGNWDQDIWMRDPAVLKIDGIWHCFYTHIEKRDVQQGKIQPALGRIRSRDLTCWSDPEIILSGPEGFSSPGNVLKTPEGYVVCLQSYPVRPGELYGSAQCRLWLMKSRDLVKFEKPVQASPGGCRAQWAKSRRQIDPYLIFENDRYYMFYKTEGCIGVLQSSDLRDFEEYADKRPVLAPSDLPDGVTAENPCVIQTDGKYRMFFAPCRPGRGIGTAWSDDLLQWKEVRYLDFPKEGWAPGGPTAPAVIDDREESGDWIMFYHGDTEGVHGGALGMARSKDLVHWVT